MRYRICCVLALLVGCRLALGALPGAGEIDRLVQPYIDGHWCTGLVVGVIDETGTRVYGYGLTRQEGGRRPDGQTVYEIGSISKTFTGLLLAQAVLAREVGLEDPVQKYLPDGVKMPQVGDEPITLRMLSTHHSGLPRMPANFRPANWSNPYADYSVRQMYEFLGDCKPKYKPGEHHEYSNLGAGLLGHVLALKAGSTYEQLLLDRICGPLKMTSTRITFDDSMRSRLAAPYDAQDKPAANWDIPTFAGAGAIRSTANDMLKYLSAELGLTRTELDEAIRFSQVRRGTINGRDGMALGWHIHDKRNCLWHNGQTGGYHSYAGIVVEKKIGVVVLCNTAVGLVDTIGTDVLRMMLGEKIVPPSPGTRPATGK